jgi:hypothetical protein
MSSDTPESNTNMPDDHTDTRVVQSMHSSNPVSTLLLNWLTPLLRLGRGRPLEPSVSLKLLLFHLSFFVFFSEL